jgi:Polymer-forming cytoskeletal
MHTQLSKQKRNFTMLVNTKYEFTGETKLSFDGITILKQIRSLVEIASLGIDAGSVGGWIEKESNLSVSDNAWVYGNARVYGNASVYGNARVYGNVSVYGNASVSDNAWVYGNARVYGNASVYGNARVYGNVSVYGNASVSKVNLMAVRSDGWCFSVVATKSGEIKIIAGCRYFSISEARTHWINTRGGTRLGEESLLIIDYLEKMAILNNL